jgi:molybdenum cofactor cytidylyltransferase
MKPGKMAAIILAGGLSTRMKQLKPLLSLGKSTIIDHIISSFSSTGLEIIVVVGFRGEEVKAGIRHKKVLVITNHEYEKGMFTSVQAGVRQLKPGTRAFFIHPADIPLIKPPTIKQLADIFDKNPGKIIYPVFNNKRGHPTVLPGEMIEEIADAPQQGNLKDLLKKHENLAVEVPVDDRFILFDVDTPENYQELLTLYQHEPDK